MAGLRKGHCYSRVKRAYTRKSKVKSKSFVKTIPTNKIVRYAMGDLKKQYDFRVNLIAKRAVQVRHNALESCRQVVNRRLSNDVHAGDYRLVLRAYPHQILRENKMLAGAGADRMQKGMQKAFGRPIGLAAQLKKGKSVFSVDVNEINIIKAKEALKSAARRMPGQFSISIERV